MECIIAMVIAGLVIGLTTMGYGHATNKPMTPRVYNEFERLVHWMIVIVILALIFL